MLGALVLLWVHGWLPIAIAFRSNISPLVIPFLSYLSPLWFLFHLIPPFRYVMFTPS
jgi:hypothetical protein